MLNNNFILCKHKGKIKEYLVHPISKLSPNFHPTLNSLPTTHWIAARLAIMSDTPQCQHVSGRRESNEPPQHGMLIYFLLYVHTYASI